MDQDLLHLVGWDVVVLDQDLFHLVGWDVVVLDQDFFTWLVGMLLWIKRFFTCLEEMLLCMDQDLLHLIGGETAVHGSRDSSPDWWRTLVVQDLPHLFGWDFVVDQEILHLTGGEVAVDQDLLHLIGGEAVVDQDLLHLVGWDFVVDQDLLHLVGWDVIVELERLLVTLDCYWILFATVPPVGYPHSRLPHLSPLKKKKFKSNLVFFKILK